MSQNINLFSPAFRTQRQGLSLITLVQGVGIVLLGLFALQFYLHQQVGALAGELRAAEETLNSQRSRMEKLKGQIAAHKPDAQLEAEIAKLEAELKQAREASEALKGGAFGNQAGFSEYLRAFSRQTLNGLWLTGFTITGSGELEIRGRVLSPDLVASYIQRLNREAVLQGRSFARFEMNRPRVEPAADKDKTEQKALRAPRFLEFNLATTDAGRAEKTR